MSDRQIISDRLDASQPSSTPGDATESLLKGSKRQPTKQFSSDDQPRRNHILLARGFSMTFLALVLLVICLWAFSKKQPMSKWEQRSFNTLSILLTAIASLGLGSLLGHLGSMLRWPLLARTIGGLNTGHVAPTGSVRLIKRHVQERRISRTTFIVTAYLITNVVGRLSVAIFGLAYNMADKTGIEYPILATNWTSALWTGLVFPEGSGSPEADEYMSALLNAAWGGLGKYAKSPEWAYASNSTFSTGEDINLYLPSDLLISNTTLNIGTNAVEYSFELKDFKEGYAMPSNHTVHSAANCSLIQVGEGQYWRWGNGNRTGPFSWGKEDNAEVVPEILRISNETGVTPLGTTKWSSFLDRSNKSRVTPQIYILCDQAAWECWPALTETDQIQPDKKFFHPKDLYRLLTVGSSDSTYASFDHRVYLRTSSNSPNRASATDGVFCDSALFDNLSETVLSGYQLWMAGLVARLPILAIMQASPELSMFARGPHPNQTSGTAYLHTTLEINWPRVVLAAVIITSGEILAILAVLYYCNGVYTRDDSHLATAELLKTVITKFDDGKLMTGEELATSLDGALEAPVSYGTRKGQDGGPPEVDLASGLDANFPPFPRKRRFRRKTN
ncbi:hypothetical protein HOY82DRAFT_666824 [Tuber indicum]|nr:hypothetical protein HOY82DRAFT_666824 [Tuber indicum]